MGIIIGVAVGFSMFLAWGFVRGADASKTEAERIQEDLEQANYLDMAASRR